MKIFKNKLEKTGNDFAKISMSGIDEMPVGPPAEYGGSHETLNPEELFVSSINSCIMLVFYHFADKYNINLNSYSSFAEGKVEKTKSGLRFTEVAVKAEVKLENSEGEEKIEEITKLAEKYCLVSNSVTPEIKYSVSLLQNKNS